MVESHRVDGARVTRIYGAICAQNVAITGGVARKGSEEASVSLSRESVKLTGVSRSNGIGWKEIRLSRTIENGQSLP